MKKLTTFVLFAVICLTAMSQNTKQTLSSVYNENFNTVVSILWKLDGCFYIETKLADTNESFGQICIGRTVREMKTMLETTKYFLDHPELEYILIRLGDDYLKLFREADGMEEDPDTELYPFLTDGTEAYSEIPIQLITEVLQMFSLK